MAECPFCTPERFRLLESSHSVAMGDAFPVAEGHTLVVPRRHVRSIFELPDDERADLFGLLAAVRHSLHARHNLDSFTIGINDGPDAGQTVEHAHLHLIPRRTGDVPDPRGGVRLLLPQRARYWDE